MKRRIVEMIKWIYTLAVVLLISSCVTTLGGSSNAATSDYIQPVFERYSNGLPKQKGQYVNSVPHGTWIEWNGTGDTVSILNYHQGVLQGPFKIWELEKNYTQEADYALDQEIFKNVGYYSGGYLHGKYRVYYNSGLVKTSGNYNKGRMDGKWMEFESSGDTSFIINYSLGIKKGPFVIWDYLANEVLVTNAKSAEKIKHQGIFKYDRLNGNYVETYPGGTVRCSGAYIEGRREGDWTWYYPTGIIKETATFSLGKLLSSEKFNEKGY